MSLAALLTVVLGSSITAYGLLGGADFGAGILELLARGRAPERAAVTAAIGPVWEANHVWLIFSLTILFSAFPAAFAALGTALLAPLTVALLAIVLRGAAWGLRSGQEPETRAHARLGRLFEAASLVAPLAFGMAAGGLAEASTGVHGTAGSVPWTSPFAIVTGLLAVALCAQLAATLLAARGGSAGPAAAAERFRRRGLAAGICVLGLSVAAVVVADASAPGLAHGLTTAALPALVPGWAAMMLSLGALGLRHARLARAATLVSGAALLWGWFLAQSPRLIGPRLTVQAAAATHSALIALSIATGIVLLTVLPALYLLFTMFARPVPEATS